MVPSDSKNIFTANKKNILNILFESEERLTAQAYIKKIKRQFLLSFAEAKTILQELIDDQELSYNYLYGSTYVEKNFLKPVSITNHFTLKPPGFHQSLNPGNLNQKNLQKENIEITIAPGISFGSGSHPTTRLCLKAIDFCFFEREIINLDENLKAADIGTGSGVLAMAMCLAGITSCSAYEIDPLSISEVKKNIKLNHLESKINVIETTIKKSKNRFSIICANLRPPTLMALSDIIYTSLKKNGIAVISGVRQWEKDALIDTYTKKGMELIWLEETKKWSAFVLKKFVLKKKIC
jgi:ribosomal protein L11 methyltransferase